MACMHGPTLKNNHIMIFLKASGKLISRYLQIWLAHPKGIYYIFLIHLSYPITSFVIVVVVFVIFAVVVVVVVVIVDGSQDNQDLDDNDDDQKSKENGGETRSATISF